MQPIKRRDLLRASVLVFAGYGLIKVGARAVIGPDASKVLPRNAPLPHLGVRLEKVVTAAALAMCGPAAEQAWHSNLWDPAADVDALLGRLAPDQQQALSIGLHLLEEGRLGFAGFSRRNREVQHRILASWRTSGLGLKRSIWGFLHAACCSSWSATPTAWAMMDYPGPAKPSPGHAGRPVGQTVGFDWDEQVP